MKYACDWSFFTKEDYDRAVKDMNNGGTCDNYYGKIYVGQLCFDVTTPIDITEESEKIIFLDCYVPFEDTGYGSKEWDDGILPYDHDSGVDISIVGKTFEEFAEEANREIESFIEKFDTKGHDYSLVEKAKKEIILW